MEDTPISSRVLRVLRHGDTVDSTSRTFQRRNLFKKNTRTLSRGSIKEVTLRTVQQLNGEGYGVNIREAVEKELGRSLTFGSIYTILDHLEEKEFIESHWSEPIAARGGHRKQLFTITDLGVFALDNAERAQAQRQRRFSTKGAAAIFTRGYYKRLHPFLLHKEQHLFSKDSRSQFMRQKHHAHV